MQSKGDVLAKAVTFLERVAAERDSLHEVLGDLSRLIAHCTALAAQVEHTRQENALLRCVCQPTCDLISSHSQPSAQFIEFSCTLLVPCPLDLVFGQGPDQLSKSLPSHPVSSFSRAQLQT